MPQGCLEVIAEAGHQPQLEQPETVTKPWRRSCPTACRRWATELTPARSSPWALPPHRLPVDEVQHQRPDVQPPALAGEGDADSSSGQALRCCLLVVRQPGQQLPCSDVLQGVEMPSFAPDRHHTLVIAPMSTLRPATTKSFVAISRSEDALDRIR